MDDYKKMELENRVEKLEKSHEEYEKTTSKVFAILKKLEERLIGGIDSDIPGFLPEFKQLKKDFDEHKVKVATLEAKMPTADILATIARNSNEIDDLKKYKWIMYGAAMVIGYLIKTYVPFFK